MPVEIANVLLETFTRLKKYRIFWRLAPKLQLPGIENLDEKLSGITHINITTYFPQNELLG
jgi:hypothetical protein